MLAPCAKTLPADNAANHCRTWRCGFVPIELALSHNVMLRYVKSKTYDVNFSEPAPIWR